jgi:hypothetical protein
MSTPVTNENKAVYVREKFDFALTRRVNMEIGAFMRGLFDVV